MGDSTNVACRTCKVDYYLGYGSYRTSSQRQERFPVRQHQGHDYFFYCGDSIYGEENGNLYQMGTYATKGFMIAENFGEFKKVDLSMEEANMAKMNMKRTLDYSDLLNPSNELYFTTIPADVWGELNSRAQKLIDKQAAYLSAKMEADKCIAAGEQDVDMPENVGEPSYLVEHWRSIRKGVVPFGLSVEAVSTGSARVKVGK